MTRSGATIAPSRTMQARALSRLAEPDALLRRPLPGKSRLAGRGVVAAYSLALIVVYARWVPRWLQDETAKAVVASRSSAGVPYKQLALAAVSLAILSALAWVGLAALVYVRRSRDLFGLLLTVSFISYGILLTDLGGIVGMQRTDSWAPWPATLLLVASALSLPWVYCFPDGRFVPRWTVALGALWIAFQLGFAIGGPFVYASTLGNTGDTALTIALVTSTVLSLGYRYWRKSTPAERQQLKWVQLGGVAFVIVYLLLVPSGALVAQNPASAQSFLFQTINAMVFSLGVIGIPIALWIAIFRQGLLDIGLIINRAITYLAITVILVGALVIVTVTANWALGAVTGQRSDIVLLASALPVAIAFVPLRRRALRVADRFVSDRRVVTLLFLDIVASTERAYALGDEAWRSLLVRFRREVRSQLKKHRGREIDTAGDSFFATFKAPESAIACARAIVDAVRSLGLEVRVGVHIGEVRVDGENITGADVHVAARIMATAGAGEVLVSRAVRDAMAGSSVEMTDRGAHPLKGVPNDVQLFAAKA